MVTTTKYTRTSNNTKPHPCFTCIEPLVGYTDHPGSCKYINESSPSSLEYVADCNTSDRNNISEYECRKVVVSYRSVETFLRRDCAPKGLCSWKDKTGSMINTPVSDCVYTDEISEKLECIYCCDTPLCNRTHSHHVTNRVFIIYLMVIVYRHWMFV